jgi:hypothetical protein
VHLNRPTLRELAIGLGLLRPLHAAEREEALRRCAAYLDFLLRSNSTVHTLLDQQLAVAVLEHWLTL